MGNKINVILLGANYYGEMASSQRVYNLFSSLVTRGIVMLHNIVHYQNEVLVSDNKVLVYAPSLKRRVFNRLIYPFYILKRLKQCYCKETKNIIYHYGYPSVESVFFLKMAQKMGIKIVFDIVENIYAFSTQHMSLIHKLKYVSGIYLAKNVAHLGDMCCAISHPLVVLCEQLTRKQIPTLFLPISVDVNLVASYAKNRDNNSTIVFYGGSFGKKDGFPYLIQGFTQAWKQNKQLCLYLTGKIARESLEEVQELLNQSEAADAIHYFGCVPKDVYYVYVANADILCMPRVNSLFANSGFPFKLGEYLASGNAVVATRTSDVEKYLTHKKNAFLIEPENSDDICNAILELSGDDRKRISIGIEGQRVAYENFDVNIVSKILYDILNAL
ncbi:MAG: glycosyltransferase [Paludibacteraceae bacterium]|nr:glycosyltransferase [Paludibacteraceae bacterium]